jgi:molecular chaperone GrpE
VKPADDNAGDVAVEPVSPVFDSPPATDPESAASGDAAVFQDRWLRAEADMQNLRRRAAREREEARRAAEEAVMLDVVSILDDLERALEAARADGAESAWLGGVELVAARMRESLIRRGVEILDPTGMPFDPAFHEALMEVPAGEGMRAGEVARVVLKGYRREGRPLRPARVVVAGAPEQER